jgi:hypothetical protein
MDWLEKRLGEEHWNAIIAAHSEHDIGLHRIVDGNLRGIMDQFEHMKRIFDGTLPRERQYIRLPGSFGADLDDPERGIEGGRIRVTE